MSFDDFIQKYQLKNDATSNKKFYHVLSLLGPSDLSLGVSEKWTI